jgi:uncharacterized protein (TIGR03437 family)
MRPLRAAATFVAAAFALLPVLLTAYSGGPPNRRTGAPGDRTCLDANCHVGPRVEMSAALTLDTGESFTYSPGAPPQRWKVRIDDPAARAYGMQVTVRSAFDLERSGAGDLTTAEDRTSSICDNEKFRGLLACPPEHSVQFLHHTEPKRAGEFTFNWTPPALPQDAAIYVIANASVAGQRNARIHSRTFLLRPRDSGGVVNAASLADAISGGAWISIFGRGFGGAGELRVQVNGRDAPIGFASDTQINALAPADDAVGPVRVEVRRGGELLATRLAMRQRWAPAFFPLLQNANGDALAGEVRPGDELTVYGTGFAGDVSLRLGDVDVPLRRRRAVTAGVEAFDLTIPDSARAEAFLLGQSGGVQTPATLRLRVTR